MMSLVPTQDEIYTIVKFFVNFDVFIFNFEILSLLIIDVIYLW
jgi:hypothetical protein